MTPEVVESHRGNKVKASFYLFPMGINRHRKDKHVVLKVFNKTQIYCLWPEPWGWLIVRLVRIDEQSALTYIKMGRKYIDLTVPTQADIQFLRTNTEKL
jgi:hypothetical protein